MSDKLISEKWLSDYLDGYDAKVLEPAALQMLNNFYAELTKAPVVDAVEVVRCFQCRYWEPSDNGRWMTKGRTDGVCRMLLDIHCSARYMTEKEHFCSYGERREENAVD